MWAHLLFASAQSRDRRHTSFDICSGDSGQMYKELCVYIQDLY